MERSTVKPVLQALVLADHVYTDKSGKKIIAGTFNQILQRKVELSAQLPPDPTTGKQRIAVRGGTDMGCPWFYLSLTDVIDGTQILLQLVHRSKNEVLLETPIKIQNKDRLATIEIVGPLPPLGHLLSEPGEYSFDVVSSAGEILGAHRLIVTLVQKGRGSRYMTTEYVNTSTSATFDSDWTKGKSYRFHVLILREDDGTFSAIALNLPGVGSMGDTEEEAVANFHEAAVGVIESYTAAGEAIPWKSEVDGGDIPDGARHKWIIVRV